MNAAVKQQFYGGAEYRDMYATLRHVRCLFYKSILCFSCYFIIISYTECFVCTLLKCDFQVPSMVVTLMYLL